ncbi:hypothetical protein ZIOFF_036033 [Zingiber officinale]|uniref:Uncharacterized protein n=1 Tax=Zingiber officinale TaxID=94328 RepID=A0A8J5L169_ZINOF|nr:hypothetical protein ZIOFF_036033 [Zingiber officinale]
MFLETPATAVAVAGGGRGDWRRRLLLEEATLEGEAALETPATTVAIAGGGWRRRLLLEEATPEGEAALDAIRDGGARFSPWQRLDFNQLKALPEAIGKLECLEILTLHYNRVKSLPSTMSSLSKLKELNVSFNELESIPESLCLVKSLVKLDVGRNFADLRMLPRSIGNLEMLEELDISSNQIRILPDSFSLLAKLRMFNADETPLEMPPKDVIKLGAQAVVQYMADSVRAKTEGSRQAEPKDCLFWLCSLCSTIDEE